MFLLWRLYWSWLRVLQQLLRGPDERAKAGAGRPLPGNTDQPTHFAYLRLIEASCPGSQGDPGLRNESAFCWMSA